MSGSGTARSPFDVLALVCSTGGLSALTAVLRALPADLSTPVVVLQHRSAGAPDLLAGILARVARLPVRAAVPGVPLSGPGVAVVPAEHSLTLDPTRLVELPAADRGQGGDVLLDSLARAYGAGTLAMVLTGRLDDGAHGVRAVKRAGGRVLVQDPATATAESMPRAAIATGCVDHVLPVRLLGPAVVALCMAPGGAAYLSVPLPGWARLAADAPLQSA